MQGNGMPGNGQVKTPRQPAPEPDASSACADSASADSSPEIDASAITAPEMDALPSSPVTPACIAFSCKQCGSRIETEAANAGLPCMCPGCHVDLIIPGAARPIFLPPPPAPRVAAPLDRVTLAILLVVVALSAVLLVAMWSR
jgi:hypothetical protein